MVGLQKIYEKNILECGLHEEGRKEKEIVGGLKLHDSEEG